MTTPKFKIDSLPLHIPLVDGVNTEAKFSLCTKVLEKLGVKKQHCVLHVYDKPAIGRIPVKLFTLAGVLHIWRWDLPTRQDVAKHEKDFGINLFTGSVIDRLISSLFPNTTEVTVYIRFTQNKV